MPDTSITASHGRTVARSYADELRSRSDTELATLVRHRPDLVRPAPANLSALAARAATVPSTRRALEQLDAGLLHVLEAVLVAGTADTAPALLGTDAGDIVEPLQALWERGLLWRSPDGLRTARAVGEALSHPAGLGPPSASLGHRPPTDVSAAIAHLSEAARTVLERMRWAVPRATFDGETLKSARDELVSVGLLSRAEGEDAVLPREVGLALRRGRLHEHPLDPPTTDGVPVRSPADVDAAAGAEALELLSQVEEVARAWEEDPPRVLRSGGLSVKDHKAVSALLDVSGERSAFVVEIASAAGLLAPDGELEPSWLPTPSYDDWRAVPPGERWARLVLTWWVTSRAPSLVSERIDGKVVNVLSEQAAWPLLRTRRRDVVTVLADLRPGAAPSLDVVEAHLRWRRPLRLPSGAPTQAAAVLQEAAWLGVLGRGALSAVGRELIDGPDADDLAGVASTHLPEPVDHVLVQADLTAVAPGPLTDDLHRLMRLAADIESRGGATVFRFTSRSIRRALDAGTSSADLLDQLRSASMTPLPQPLEYLVTDLARRHGQARVGAVGCYIRSDDETALSAMLADSDLAALQLRRIAPTVLVSPAPAGSALPLLAEHSPVAETSDGGLLLTGRQARRARSARAASTPTVTVEQVGGGPAEEIVTRLRHREESDAKHAAAREGPPIPETDATVAVTMLADAAADNAAVWIGYVDATGSPQRALFHPEQVHGGRAIGTVEGSATRRAFVIHRVTGVVPA